jgi:hypothetical protein
MKCFRAINVDDGAINCHKRAIKENDRAIIQNDGAINMEFTECLIYSSRRAGHRLVYKQHITKKKEGVPSK